MKIDPTKQLPRVVERLLQRIRDEALRERGSSPSRIAQTEQLDLSSLAQEIERLKTEIAALPDVRAEKIAELREKIARGEYPIDATALAERLLEHLTLLDDHVQRGEREP